MPTVELQIVYKEAYRHHFPADWQGPFIRNASYTVEPSSIQLPGDIDTIGDRVDRGAFGLSQRAKLTTQVTIRFPDGFEIVFPVNSEVELYWSRDLQNVSGVGLTDDHGMPRPPLAAPVAGGRLQNRRLRRNTRRRRSKRNTSRSRRH